MEDETMHSEVDSSSHELHWDASSPSPPPSSPSPAAANPVPEFNQCSTSPQRRGRKRQGPQDEATGPEDPRSQLVRLRASNDALRHNIAALRMLAAEADRVTARLAMMPPPRPLPTSPPAVNPSGVAAHLLELAFSEDYENDLSLENQYVSLPGEIMVALEAAFRRRLSEVVAQWTCELGSRPSLERRLASAMRSRINGTRALSLKCPDIQAKLVSAMLPDPGSAASAAARIRLACLAADLGIDGRQKERLREALAEFRHTVDGLKQEVDTAQLTAAVCLTAGENAEHAAFRMLSLNLVAHNSVALTTTAGIFQQLQRRTLYAYLRLATGVLGSLSAVQGARLLLGSLPYLPDHAELCVIVCGEE